MTQQKFMEIKEKYKKKESKREIEKERIRESVVVLAILGALPNYSLLLQGR